MMEYGYCRGNMAWTCYPCCKPISIPLEQNVKLSVEKCEFVEDVTMYIHIVGSLIYMIYHQTRFDLCYGFGESIHASTKEATFGCNQAHIEVYEVHIAL